MPTIVLKSHDYLNNNVPLCITVVTCWKVMLLLKEKIFQKLWVNCHLLNNDINKVILSYLTGQKKHVLSALGTLNLPYQDLTYKPTSFSQILWSIIGMQHTWIFACYKKNIVQSFLFVWLFVCFLLLHLSKLIQGQKVESLSLVNRQIILTYNDVHSHFVIFWNKI